MLLLVVAIHIIGVQLRVDSECQSDTPHHTAMHYDPMAEYELLRRL